MTTEDACPDCGRPFATDEPAWRAMSRTSRQLSCGVRFESEGDDATWSDCLHFEVLKLRSELATRRTWKVDEATAAELARLKRELAEADARAGKFIGESLSLACDGQRLCSIVDQLRSELASARELGEESVLRRFKSRVETSKWLSDGSKESAWGRAYQEAMTEALLALRAKQGGE